MDKRRREKKDPSEEYIQRICDLYGDTYDDREEDTSIGGLDWAPGKQAKHLSLVAFQRKLNEKGIELSTGKIRKILITGGLWSTERSRTTAELFSRLGSVKKVAAELHVSECLVNMYLPYGKVVYDLEEKSGNAKRIERSRRRKAGDLNLKLD